MNISIKMYKVMDIYIYILNTNLNLNMYNLREHVQYIFMYCPYMGMCKIREQFYVHVHQHVHLHEHEQEHEYED
jgi:hypothetical protein